MLHGIMLLAAEASEVAEKGGLFDLDATLPLIAIEFLLLVAVLNAIFYRPVTQTIDERNDYIRLSLAEAKERTLKTEALAKQYQDEIAQARLKAQQTLAEAEASAAKIRAQRLSEVQAEIQAKLEAARIAVEAEKQTALADLQRQVSDLSQQIIDKLLVAV